MNTKNMLFGSIILLVVGLLLGVFTGYMIWHPKKVGIGLPKYFPVVIKVNRYIEKPVPYKIVIPPHIEYQYLSYEDSMRFVGVIDSLICLAGKDGKTDTVWVKPKFLTSFPTAPKLINMDIQMDSISITGLTTQAELTQRKYPLNLFEFKYRYDGHTMSVEPLKQRWGVPKVSKWRFGIYANMGSDLIDYPTFHPYVSAGGELSFSRIRLVIEPKVTISKSPTLGLDTKIGIKLWEWPK